MISYKIQPALQPLKYCRLSTGSTNAKWCWFLVIQLKQPAVDEYQMELTAKFFFNLCLVSFHSSKLLSCEAFDHVILANLLAEISCSRRTESLTLFKVVDSINHQSPWTL